MDLTQKIMNKFNEYTYAQKRIANYLLDHVDQLPYTNLAKISKDMGTSTTSVIRFAKTLGYKGYKEMQRDFKREAPKKTQESDEQEKNKRKSQDALLKEAMETDIKNIEETLASLDTKELKKAVKHISEANTVYVLGMRSSYAAAYYMASRLGEIKKNVRFIQSSGMMYPEEILGAKRGDVLIAFLFPRYSKVATGITSWIKERGTKVILITGINEEPIKAYGDIILPCATKSVHFRNSYAAPLSLSNYLTRAVYEKTKDEAEENTKMTEELLDQGYYLPL